MTTILLNAQNIEFLKKAARKQFPNVGSSHLTEALAAGLGFKKHASLLAAQQLPESRLIAVQFSNPKFSWRLQQLVDLSAEQKYDLVGFNLSVTQQDLPVSSWRPAQSNAIYHSYSKERLPIIFVKDRKRKYCTLDYDYHFQMMFGRKSLIFSKIEDAARRRLFSECLRLAKELEMPLSFFHGKLNTGWVYKVEIEKVEFFADSFAYFYFNLIREIEIELEKQSELKTG